MVMVVKKRETYDTIRSDNLYVICIISHIESIDITPLDATETRFLDYSNCVIVAFEL